MHTPVLSPDALTLALTGSVCETVGAAVAVADFPAPIGAVVEIHRQAETPLRAEVVGFRSGRTIVLPFQNAAGLRPGARVRLVRTRTTLRVGDGLLGRVVDAHGHAIDGMPQPVLSGRVPIDREPPSAVERPRIDAALSTGVRAIDGMLTCGRGQRLGVFAGSGVGKSMLLGMMARYTEADVTVIGLVGERGREVNEFIERDLGPEGLARSVLVVATSNEPALVRQRAAFTATAIAEHFRDQGKNVLLLVDSITRLAMASREIGLAAGEPPATRGYPPSTFALLPKLVERAGRTCHGSITAYYSVLVEGDDPDEPIADAVRGLLDGHVWLSRKLAGRGHFPAIDLLSSISRLMQQVTGPEQQEAARVMRQVLAAQQENEDLIAIGAYRKGSNPWVDAALDRRAEIEALLRQPMDEPTALEDTSRLLCKLAQLCQTKPSPAPPAGNLINR
ncbi:Flagellum-specific ATP synthase [Pirellulimonas nuda]|uniref:Flagellum-specific ATP synthase n=1 Tax=Pirellulimonas nuda TaxID=2528009 RepID=A0A518D9S3_9BACT|nr:FliI/YscN family ATPase [Pirellulimonas nuda]QDU88231.1 Flagellum-specific ATP synthase [Pirellulimonas nuda]